MQQLESGLEKMLEMIILKVPSIVVALLIIFFGRILIRWVLRLVDRRFEKKNVDRSSRDFIKTLIRFALYALVFLTAANTMGIQTTSFIAAMSAFGLAVGMALQGSLSNFAGGVLILLFKPFEVDDYIVSDNGSSGSVERIDILYTTITDDDGIQVFSPNGTLANSVIKNYSKILSRRFTFSFLISYDTDIKLTRQHILDLLKKDEGVLQTPAPDVVVDGLDENGIKLTVYAWAKKEVYWSVRYGIGERITAILGDKQVQFPKNLVHVAPLNGEDQAEA